MPLSNPLDQLPKMERRFALLLNYMEIIC